ncbi:MAG: DNA polymerase III subunit delta' [Alphaproteobacteria bacterium]|nr:DNA polymerase III subunit delta' [Alphaproteobacteria bacterium]
MTETATQGDVAPEPRANADLRGHETAERELAEAARSGRLHHAWLITGPKGIGKATLAHRFARWLLAGRAEAAADGGLFAEQPAQEGLWLDPADPLFQRIAAGGHPDMLTVERGLDDAGKRLRTEIVAADARKVSSFLALTAAEGGWRVVVVDGAEDMNRHAANALLKILEEPPPRTVLLLVSHAPGRLLATIRSRCRRLTLSPLDGGLVEELLAHYRPDLQPPEAALLAAMGEGSIGRSLALAEAGGVALYGEMLELLAALPETEAARLHGVTDAIARSRSETGAYAAYDVFTDLLCWWIARLVRSRATGIAPAELSPGEGEVMARLGALGSLDQWVEVWEKITRLFGRAESVNLDRKQVLLNAFFTLARIGS